MSLLSIVVPCYNEEESVSIFYAEIKNTLLDTEYEIIFVDDGSVDNTLREMKRLVDNDSNVKFVSFSRNFGKESALYAGIKKAKGDMVCIMDVDLQDPPKLLPHMISYVGEYDIVATRRVSRNGEPAIRSFFARMFYRFINHISKIELVDGARDYRVMTRQVAEAILEIKEYNRFSKGLFEWVGFKTKWLEYENIERVAGETSWSFWGLFTYSIEGIVAFTVLPLSLSIFFGIIISIISFIFILVIVIRNLIFPDSVAGWASTMSVILFLGGLLLFSIGMLGKYLEKIYSEVKNRPLYIIRETNVED